MAIYKEILNTDITTARSYLNQLIDVLQEDISGSASRRKYQHFVTGGVGPGVTSSLFQTVYDQDFTLQTANPIFDVAVGLRPGSTTVTNVLAGYDSAGKELFPSTTLMMREKLDIYRQFAQSLLGNNSSSFKFPSNSNDANDVVDAAMFISYKRLFARDAIKDQTFVMQFYSSGSSDSLLGYNLNVTSINGSSLYTDFGTSLNKVIDIGGTHANIVNAANKDQTVGQIYYDRGIVIFDLAKIMSGAEHVSGSISSINSLSGFGNIGGPIATNPLSNPNAKFISDLMTSGSVDNILDHLCGCRFQSGSLTSTTFQNVTNINSTLVFCRAAADEFNYSQNPTYVDANNRITVIDPGQENTQKSFTYVTSIGLYDANDNLLAVSKVSRPIEKNSERDLTFRVRLDF
jgi:hypothetical protein